MENKKNNTSFSINYANHTEIVSYVFFCIAIQTTDICVDLLDIDLQMRIVFLTVPV